MKKPKTQTPIMIGNSILWAVAMLASAILLRGTEQATDILFLLIFLWTASYIMLQNDEHSLQAEWECIRNFFSRQGFKDAG